VIMERFDIDKILLVIFEEVRRMPGKDLRGKLIEVQQELDKRFRDVMDTLIEHDKGRRDNEPLKRGRQNDK